VTTVVVRVCVKLGFKRIRFRGSGKDFPGLCDFGVLKLAEVHLKQFHLVFENIAQIA